MYYRYEVRRDDGTWAGICTMLNPSERRAFNRMIREPEWYGKPGNAERKSTCWLTEEGFEKYGNRIAKLIENHRAWVETPPVRIRKVRTLDNIVVRGKIQVINLEE